MPPCGPTELQVSNIIKQRVTISINNAYLINCYMRSLILIEIGYKSANVIHNIYTIDICSRNIWILQATSIPDKKSILEWFSLMQHHGAPTRFLDFTYSIWVAAYFALEHAEGDCAIWAVNYKTAAREYAKVMKAAGVREPNKIDKRLVEGDEDVFREQLFKKPYQTVVCPLNPFRLNERLRIQKGLFLVPGDVTLSFMDNLNALHGNNQVIKFVIPQALRRHGLSNLFNMNISRTSLFPGLDGYAQSLSIYHPMVHPNWLA